MAADLFSFQDLAGYEKCLRQGAVIESNTPQSGTKIHRMLSESEVIERCVDQAKRLASAKPKNLAFTKDLVSTTKRNVNHEMALDLIYILVQRDIKACNDIANFETLQSALARPADYPSAHDSFFDHAQKIIVQCLKDTEFRSDFVEEMQSADANIRANSCKILTAQKVVTGCHRKP